MYTKHQTPKATEVSAGITCSENNCTMNSSSVEGNITNWNWNFGDGNTSSSENKTHTYTSAGNYNVCLTITNEFNLTTEECTEVAIVDFTPNCNELSCNFSSTNLTNVLSWDWNLGDGSVNKTSKDISHVYNTSGDYNVCVESESSDNVKDKKCKSINVNQ